MNITDLARVRDEDLVREPVGQASGAGARALMDSIMSEKREPVRTRFPWWRGLGLGAVAVALAAALIVWVPVGGPVTEYANAAVTLRTGEDFITVTITDPEAEAETFAEAFRAVGLNAEVKKVPVAAQDVGKLIGPAASGTFPPGTGMTIQSSYDCASAWCGRISMPVGFTGNIVFGIGRLAAPGEPYAQRVQIIPIPPPEFRTDGSEGYDGAGKPVSKVRAEMERRGLKLTYELMWLKPDGSGAGYHVDADQIKDDWIVESGSKLASDAVELTVLAPKTVPYDSVPGSKLPSPHHWAED
ncbi:hypothetical protein [Nonomuraea glycinis]|uniref:hypothetical protein n=1 Tax=Nonomuraea glycinis TaxID=2047744 RepID=UPI002E119F00|nr:hypothetical protein OHA68_12795 [Nonomuraea glycinis]